MDVHKHRSSLDDPRHALRRLANSPRLSLRRPPSTTSAASSSASSIVSHDTNEDPQSCVGRDVANEDCALNRFIVWAAVKRNACQKMTPEEKKECPLLRCRKRFDDHEQMLKHLVTCDELSAGEYWCYECARVERFADAKPKKCPSHPSKRKKAMTKARSFFSSLGHRSKNDPLIDLDPVEESFPPALNYDDDVPFPLLAPSPLQAELQSNEIHEIDSVELTPLPMIMEDEREGLDAPPTMSTMVTRQPTLPAYAFPISPPTIHPTELECGMTSNALARSSSSAQPPTIVPADLINDDEDKEFERPSLHLHTTGLEQYRRKVKAAKSRSKYLGPSSSVRSTASTDSTNSTSTTASYAISPISAWSGPGWLRDNEFESTLTSPADEFMSCDPFGPVHEPLETFDCHFEDQFGVKFDDAMLADSFPLQPLADLDMSDLTTHADNIIAPMDFAQVGVPLYQFDGSETSDLTLALRLDDSMPAIKVHEAMPQPNSGPGIYGGEGVPADGSRNKACGMDKGSTPRRSDSAKKERRRKAVTLTRNAYQALQLHIAESVSRIRHIRNSPLVDKWRRMAPDAVFMAGLDALTSMLNGFIVASPSDLLCFVHLAYSLSLVMHEEDSLMRGTKLFSQAVSYASWLTREDRKPYLAIVNHLWKPSTMSDGVVIDLMRSASSASRSRYSEADKLMDRSYDVVRDALAGVAQLFLDELEYTTVFKPGETNEHGGELFGEAWAGANVAFYRDASLKNAADLLQHSLLQRYGHQPGYANGLGQLFGQLEEGCQSTLRHFELGLLHIGKTALPSETFTETYAPQIRKHVDTISTQAGIQSTPRPVYYQHGIKLVRSIVEEETSKGRGVKDNENMPAPPLETVNNLESTMSQVAGFGISPTSTNDLSSPYGLDIADDTIGNSTATTFDGLATPVTACTTAATTPPSPGPAHANSAAGIRVESHSCCELCGYRPEGDPRWFPGSMAKHKKLQHGTSPPKIYQCPYPGCTSQYRNRPDNLRQHQLKKGHFVDGIDDITPRPPKRKKMDS